MRFAKRDTIHHRNFNRDTTSFTFTVMKTSRLITLLLALCLSVTPIHFKLSFAQSQATAVTFEKLNVRDVHLRGPLQTKFVSFALPAHWELSAPARFEFDLDIIIPGDVSATDVAVQPVTRTITQTTPAIVSGCFAGILYVSMNDKLVGQFPLAQGGQRTLSVPIPEENLATLRKKDGRTNLLLTLDNPDPCLKEQNTQVFIRSSSRLISNKRDVEPPLDLALFPRPLFQQSVEPDSAMLVVPDRPTAQELTAALNLVSGLSRVTSEQLGLTLTTVSRMTEEMWKSNHLIVIGKPGNLPVFGAIKLPNPPVGEKFNFGEPNDGIIQIAISPYNRTKVAMVVSGNSDAGVEKAGKAISSGAIRGRTPNAAIITDINITAVLTESLPIERTFASLGYDTIRSQGVGTNFVSVDFVAPEELSVVGESYVELSFVHSALLDYDRSAINLYMNDIAIGSIRLDDNSTRTSKTRVSIPSRVVRPGANRLLLQTDLQQRGDNAQNASFNSMWLSIQSDSLLRMQFGNSANPEQRVTRVNLNTYPKPFADRPNLDNLAFVLAQNDPNGWSAAAELAYGMGRQAGNFALDIQAVYADTVSDDTKKARHLVVVGKPSALPIIQDLNVVLPAPFDSGKNIATERNANVSYRVADGDDVGYVQSATSPFNSLNAILLVVGSTDTGVRWASKSLNDNDLRGSFNGNLAFVNDRQVVASNVRVALPQSVQASVPAASATTAANAQTQPVGAAQPAPQPVNAAGESSNSLLLILFGLAGIAIVFIIANALLSSMRKKNSADTY
jgi:hypothetical protein